MPRSSIIIPVFNKAALTRQCLDAVFQDLNDECEVIVVNDASTDCTHGLLENYGDRIRVVTHRVNSGFAISCNDGAAVARGEFLVFLNNDTIPQEGWLEALESYALSHPKAAAVGAKMLFPDNTIQHAGVVILSQNRCPSHIYTGFPQNHPAVNKSRRFQVVTAGCVLIRREAFEWANGFDPAYHNGYEDVDLCLRFGEKGDEVHYCHKSVLYHLESRTRDTVSPVQRSNEQLYTRRWGSKVHPDDFFYYIEDELLKVHCPSMYPIYIEASPQLAINAPWVRPERADRMLFTRARQVYDLLQENLELLVRTREAEGAVSQTDGNGMHPVPRSTVNGNGMEPDNTVQQETDSSLLKAEIEVLKAQHAYDQLRILELRKMLLDTHNKLLHRDTQLIEAYGAKEGKTRSPGFPFDLLRISTDKTISDLLSFLDELDRAVGKIYLTRRWQWANPITMMRRMFLSSRSIRGYWRIDDILANYKEWRINHLDG